MSMQYEIISPCVESVEPCLTFFLVPRLELVHLVSTIHVEASGVRLAALLIGKYILHET